MQLERKHIKFFDYPLAVTVVGLCIMGLLALASATGNIVIDPGTGWLQAFSDMNKHYIQLSLLWIGVGFILAAGVMLVNYTSIGRFSGLIYWLNVALLGLVLVVGIKQGGTTGWFKVNEERTFQPSEIAKLALIITLAKQLSARPGGIKTVRELIPVLASVLLPCVLLFMQPDYGTLAVYLFITGVLLYVSGTDWKLLLALVVIAAVLVVIFWNVLPDDSVQKTRILTFLHPELDPNGTGYNVKQSKLAIGSGGITGKGFFAAGSLTTLDAIPVKMSDFIFATLAETMGFRGAIIVVALYAFLLVRMIILSRRSFDRFGSFLIVGVTAMMGFHIFENIGMCLGVMPCTGIPLPFISYGGSSMLTNFIAIGLVLNVGLRRRRSIFLESEQY